MTIKHFAYTALSAGLFLTSIQSAQAAGFYIQEQSVKGLGSAFAGSSTSLEDASTVYFNPAGMTKLDGININIGAHLLIPSASLTDTGSTFGGPAISGNNGGNPYAATPIPNFFATAPIIQDTLWAGIGITAPFGLANNYDDGWFGRYDSTETELTTLNIQPSIAIKATDWLSIGGGIDIQHVDAELKSAARVVTEGVSKLKGDDWSIGYNIGTQLQPAEHTEIAIHYRSAIKHTLDGRISLQGTGAGEFNVTGTADLNLPDVATFGAAHNINDQWRIMGQATWFGWNNFEEIRAKNDAGATISNVVQGYQNTWAFAIGAEYDWSDDWIFRAGYQYDETPTVDQFRTSRTPDGDRNWFSTGATYKIQPNLELDLAATYINISDETINVSRNTGAAIVSADTDGSVGILAIGLNYKF